MAGLVPAIHVLLAEIAKFVDAGHKAGHDSYWSLFRWLLSFAQYSSRFLISRSKPR